jgi:cellulose synthase/poly-beta-1,6-N-acetylglucosamine synthase-like glycosyltransferase
MENPVIDQLLATVGVLLQGLTFGSLVLATMVCGYYLALATVALAARRRKQGSRGCAVHDFAIVIPAHNEEAVIAHTLISCAALQYPEEKVTVYVVADNCTDRTARIAAVRGAICLERNDPSHPGKGYALEWAFQQIAPERHDAFVVLDADCVLDPWALQRFDQCLTNGARVLQANDVAANPDSSAISYVASVANRLENDFFYAPKSRIGSAVFLRGTGMVLHRDVLERYPWRARSIVEDLVYSVDLLRGGASIRFVDDVCVRSEFPAAGKQLRVQRSRWIGGNLAVARLHALPLIVDGVQRRQWRLIDAGWTLLVSMRSFVLIHLLGTMALAIACRACVPGLLSNLLMSTGLALVSCYGLYFLLGVGSLGLSPRRWRLLLTSPLILIKMLQVALHGALRVDLQTWVKMPREQEPA